MEFASLLRLFRIAHFKPNLKADTDGLRPTISPADSFGKPEDDDHAVELFIEQVVLVADDDYGDFMRKVNLYIGRLKSHLRHRDPDILERIEFMQLYVQFCPNWSVSLTRPWVLKKAVELKNCIHEKLLERARAKRDGLAFVWPQPKPWRRPTWKPRPV